MANEQIFVDTGSFFNDMINFKSGDDILTLLIHLVYLNNKAYIPDQEVVDLFVQSVKTSHCDHISEALMDSQELLEAIWNKEERVTTIIQKNHYISSVIKYNNEKHLHLRCRFLFIQ